MKTQLAASIKLSPAEVLDDVIISIAIDSSSSMHPVANETRNAVNEYITELQSGTPITFSLATFSGKVTWQIEHKSVDIAQKLTYATYNPSGGTALYDAIGESIERIENMDIPPVHPVIVIFTDGQDANSKKYNANKIKEMISERRERGWRFIAFIIGRNARISTERAGFLKDDIAEYLSTAKSTNDAFKKLTASTKRLINAVEMKALPPAKFLE